MHTLTRCLLCALQASGGGPRQVATASQPVRACSRLTLRTQLRMQPSCSQDSDPPLSAAMRMPPPLPPHGMLAGSVARVRRWSRRCFAHNLLTFTLCFNTFYKSEARGQRWLADVLAQSRGKLSLDNEAQFGKRGQKGQDAGWLLKTESSPEAGNKAQY